LRAVDQLEILSRAGDGFEAKAAAIPADGWERTTPCQPWTVRDVVNHVVAGNLMSARLLGGASRDEALEVIRDQHLGDDWQGALRRSIAAQAQAFAAPGALERICHHPAADIPGSMLLGFRLGDLVLHAWDIARGAGLDETLDPVAVEAVWTGMSALGPLVAQSGFFGTGASGTVPEDAPLQLRLLDLAGRRP
jgi:uncharacterized protein (TIGR03086 family)